MAGRPSTRPNPYCGQGGGDIFQVDEIDNVMGGGVVGVLFQT